MTYYPCMVCQIPSNCEKAGSCLAFTQRQEPADLGLENKPDLGLDGKSHIVSAPKRYGHTWQTRCSCGWYYEGSSVARAEQRSNEHLRKMHGDDPCP
jgi:hypothetical protein